MVKLSKIKALEFLKEGERINPGPWVDHSYYTAEAAKLIADNHPELDSEFAYICGLLHDIGRRVGKTHMRHTIDGYRFLQKQGFEEVGRICLTHSFPSQDIRAAFGKWDCSKEELDFVKRYLPKIEYTQYDKLIQLCDTIALPSGFCLIEKRMIDVALRYGTSEFTILKWKATMAIKEQFENEIKQSIYKILPGIIENTFGFDKIEKMQNVTSEA